MNQILSVIMTSIKSEKDIGERNLGFSIFLIQIWYIIVFSDNPTIATSYNSLIFLPSTAPFPPPQPTLTSHPHRIPFSFTISVLQVVYFMRGSWQLSTPPLRLLTSSSSSCSAFRDISKTGCFQSWIVNKTILKKLLGVWVSIII